MRRGIWLTALMVLVAGVGATIAFVWLPAVDEHRDRAWQDAGRRAAAAVDLPDRFQPYSTLRSGSATNICGAPRCFTTDGDPRDTVSEVRTALVAVADGPVTQECVPDGGFAAAPDRCRLTASVDGSALDVFLFSRMREPVMTPVEADDFAGTIVQIVVAPRD
jgi:hypothetical protein